MSDVFDFFISYTKSDERWAQWVAQQLTDAGYTTRLMSDFGVGSNFVVEMQQGIAGSKRMIAILSSAYLKSDFCTSEWAATFRRDPTSRDKTLVPVRVEACEPDGLLGPIVYVDLVGERDARAATAKVLDGVRAHTERAPAPFPGARAAGEAAGLPPPFPGGLPPVWMVPFPQNPYLTGRDEGLNELRRMLTANPRAAVNQPQAVHGLGGVGKTQLAVEYAYRYKASYRAVLWVVADSSSAVGANLAALSAVGALALPEADAREQDVQVEAVARWLRENDGWLLIFDSADNAEAVDAITTILPPAPGGHVIVTSRRTQWPPAFSELPIEELPTEAAADFLLERTRRERHAGTREDALTLARELGGLPLALEQASAYVLRYRVNLAEYIARLRTSRSSLLAKGAEGTTRYQKSVAETWLVTEQQLSARARAILRFVGFLAPDDIPRALFTQTGAALEEAVRDIVEDSEAHSDSGQSMSTEDALAELADASLIKLAPEAVSCHRLVQATQSDRLSPNQHEEWRTRTLNLVNAFIPTDPRPSDVRSWGVWIPMRPHLETLLTKIHDEADAAVASSLIAQLGSFLRGKALFREAEPLMRRALSIAEASCGPDHPIVATYLSNLALLLHDTNRLQEAEPLMRRALSIAEALYGPNHPTVAIRLNNLASLLQATNRLQEAEPLMRRALSIDEASYGPNHPEVATDLNNLALLLHDTNRLQEAEPLMQRALSIDEVSYGPHHPKVAIRLSNMASLLQATNRFQEAEPLVRRALSIDEASYGPDHPEVATDLNNLASLLKETKRFHEAEPLMWRALSIDEASYGPDHPNVAIRLSNLASLLHATNRLQEVEPLGRRALEILVLFCRVSSHRHPLLTRVVQNYKATLEELGFKKEQIDASMREILGDLNDG